MDGWSGRAIAAGLVVGLATALGCNDGCLCDPCYPERYNAEARHEVEGAFAAQRNNGHVLDQTVWNYDFESGNDVLTTGGRSHLDYMVRRRPSADPVVYVQTAQDVPVAYDPATPDKYAAARTQLDAQRVVAVQKYLLAVSGPRGISWDVKVHDPPEVGSGGIRTDVLMQQFDKAVQPTLKTSGGGAAPAGGGS